MSQKHFCLAVSMGFLTLLAAATARAQEELEVKVEPNLATTEQPLVVTVTGTASCPTLSAPTIGEGLIEIAYRGSCGFPPPAPGPFTLYALLTPLPPGIWEIRILDRDLPVAPPAIAASAVVTVTDSRFSVELTPSPAVEGEEVIAHISGFGGCFGLIPVQIGTDSIRLEVVTFGICDPPSPSTDFTLEQSLGVLDVGLYEVEFFFSDQRVAESDLAVVPPSFCLPGLMNLCLGSEDRFRVRATWSTGESGGHGFAVEETSSSGFFWFFSPENIELVVKVIDACSSPFGSYWVFAAGLTDVGVTLEVTDVWTGSTVTYQSPAGQRFETITDTGAFPLSCP